MDKEELNNDLLQASKDGDLKKVKDLIEKGANVNSQAGNWTALHHAAVRAQTEIVSLLLKNGADIHAKDKNGLNTPLHLVAHHGSAETAKLLIENGADVNAKEFFGYTPLHVSASNNHFEVANILLKNGADIHAKDKYNNTPLNVAADKKSISIVKLILPHYELSKLKSIEKSEKGNLKSLIQDEVAKREKIRSDIKAVKKAMNVPDFEF